MFVQQLYEKIDKLAEMLVVALLQDSQANSEL
jgi:hypothetical protein